MKTLSRNKMDSLAVDFLSKRHHCSVGSNDISFEFDGRYAGASGCRMSYSRPDKRSPEVYVLDVLNFYHANNHHAPTMKRLMNIFSNSGVETNRNRISFAVHILRKRGLITPKGTCSVSNWYPKEQSGDSHKDIISLEHFAYTSMINKAESIIATIKKRPLTASLMNDIKNHRKMIKNVRKLMSYLLDTVIIAA